MKTDLEILETVNNLFTVEFAQRINAYPKNVANGVIYIGCTDANDLFLQQNIELLTNADVELEKTSVDDIETEILAFQSRHDQLKGISEEYKLNLIVEKNDREITQSLTDKDEEDAPVVRLLNTIISSALSRRASDIHIERHENRLTIKYRIDGVLVNATEDLETEIHRSLISRLKVISELDIAERRVPQDGRFKLRQGSRNIDFRLSIIPGIWGENAVIRVLDGGTAFGGSGVLHISEMGFHAEQEKVLLKAINEPHGMVLIAGPTGSGKTTTLYSALQSINNGLNKIITIEDPIEYHLNGIMQIPVNVKKGMSFAKGLRSILRHDPDKILVGEIRDLETAEIAVQSALTGHLVLSSVHSNSANDVLLRLQNIGVPMESCLSALNCVVSQRLVRLNCENCMQDDSKSALEVEALGINPEYVTVLKKSIGCHKCEHTGYKGRALIAEILEIGNDLKYSILKDETNKVVLKREDLVGKIDLRAAAKDMVINGKISAEEMNRVTYG